MQQGGLRNDYCGLYCGPVIRLVLFDIDGTLIRTGGAGREAFAQVAATQFQVPDGVANLEFAGRTDRAIVREFFLRHQIEPSPANFQRFFDAYVFWLDYLLARRPGGVLPGVRESIDALQRLAHHPIVGLLTGNIRLGAEIKLRHFGLWDYFTVGGFGDDHEDRGEIARLVQQRGSQQAGRRLRGDEILVVGDTPLDIACARVIHAKSLAVATGTFSLQELQQSNPTWAVENLAAVDLAALCV